MDEGLPVRNRGPLGAKDDEGETKRRETHAFCWNKSWPRSVSAESLRILRFRVSVETAVAASATQRTDARGAGRREAASERPTGTRDDNDISRDVSERVVPTERAFAILLDRKAWARFAPTLFFSRLRI